MKQILKLPNLCKVQSSNIQSVGYKDGEVYVSFHNGNVYKYPEVSEEVFNSLIKAESVGKQFSQTLKKADKYEKLEVVLMPDDNNQADPSETVEITLKYKGKEYKSRREFSKSLVELNKHSGGMGDIMVKEAANAAMKAMRDALNNQENQ